MIHCTSPDRNDLEEWDPMKFDHTSSFNSYASGPGQCIQSRDDKDVITLFVDHIPTAITKVHTGGPR